jgi:hypothetical protein
VKSQTKKTQCPKGHALAGANLILSPGTHGPRRKCRTCAYARRVKNRYTSHPFLEAPEVFTALCAKLDANTEPGPGGCLLWTGHVQRAAWPYPEVSAVGVKASGHRLSLERKLGRALTPGMLACHHCDTPRCVEPSHIYEGTNADNSRDRVVRGRDFHTSKTHCINGHEFSGSNLHIRTSGVYVPNRACRKCQRAAESRYNATHQDIRRAWRAKHRDELITKQRANYAANRDEINAKRRARRHITPTLHLRGDIPSPCNATQLEAHPT